MKAFGARIEGEYVIIESPLRVAVLTWPEVYMAANVLREHLLSTLPPELWSEIVKAFGARIEGEYVIIESPLRVAVLTWPEVYMAARVLREHLLSTLPPELPEREAGEADGA